MVLGGLIGPILSLENRFEVHPYRTGYINPYDDFIQRFGITHVIPTLHAGAIEKKQYFQNFPQAMRNAVLLARYPLWQTYAELYALDPSPELFPEEMKAYEGETFFGRPGMPRFDEKASRKTALFMGNKHGEILAELPLEEFSSGNYRVRFLIKIGKPDAQNKLICKLDVVDRRRRKLLAYRNLTKENFKNPETYTAFDLPLRIPRNAPISIRVYSPGKTPLLFDYAAISILEKD
jgi:hypothetical protein